jgi:phosphoketolase
MIYVAGPGHGAPAILAKPYLEGTYSEVYPAISQDMAGLRKFFQQFSFPGGIGSHCTPETPGSIHEGGELGYSLSHAFGAVFDHPSLFSLVMVGDGESETGPLATAWHSFYNRHAKQNASFYSTRSKHQDGVREGGCDGTTLIEQSVRSIAFGALQAPRNPY